MLESCGDLFTICIALGGIRFEEAIAIEIYKLNFITMVWEKVDSVKDRAFFLDSGGSTSRSCSAAASNESSSNVTGDCVYFMDEKKSLYIYQIEDGTVSVLLPCPDLPTPCLLPIWMMPPTPRQMMSKIDLEEEEEKNAVKFDQQKENTEEEEEEEEMQAKLGTRFCDLPLDMLILIGLEHLTPFDYMNFRAACKLCRLVAPPTQWRTRGAFVGSEAHLLSPWLVTKKRDKCSFVDSKLKGRYMVTVPESVSDARICCAKDGWVLLMSESHLSMFCFNPFTKAIIQIPDLPECKDPAVISEDCLVIGTILLPESGWVGFYLVELREEEWNYFELSDPAANFMPNAFWAKMGIWEFSEFSKITWRKILFGMFTMSLRDLVTTFTKTC
ncbi:hypothetical protein RJ639_009409 [Escallonia herrerae]|uniref:KIB1-4 beta-propeller domain-containing protein n=1 Tax=Escallonia herrerae TaxID=1293975 RepID=A0AA89AX38_9ASTE|nr:hypothetical protein RJ639_009409 [Escallonia herrerae]